MLLACKSPSKNILSDWLLFPEILLVCLLSYELSYAGMCKWAGLYYQITAWLILSKKGIINVCLKYD